MGQGETENVRERERERPTGKWIELVNRKGKESEKGAAWWETGKSVRIMVEA